jgi:hypothetical protein
VVTSVAGTGRVRAAVQDVLNRQVYVVAASTTSNLDAIRETAKSTVGFGKKRRAKDVSGHWQISTPDVSLVF